MKKDVNKVFLILEGFKPNLRRPITCFLESDYTRAKVYFQGYIYGEKRPERFQLYQIGEIVTKPQMRIIESKCFITGGYEIANQQNYEKQKIQQIKLEFENEKKAKDEEDFTKVIERLFGGKKNENC